MRKFASLLLVLSIFNSTVHAQEAPASNEPISLAEKARIDELKRIKAQAMSIYVKEKTITEIEAELKKGVRIVTKGGLFYPLNLMPFKYLGFLMVGGLAGTAHKIWWQRMINEGKTFPVAFRESSGWVAGTLFLLFASGFFYLSGGANTEVVYLSEKQRDELADRLIQLRQTVEDSKANLSPEVQHELRKLQAHADQPKASLDDQIVSSLNPNELKADEVLEKIKQASDLIAQTRKALAEGVRHEDSHEAWYSIPNLASLGASWLAFYPITYITAAMVPHIFTNIKMEELVDNQIGKTIDHVTSKSGWLRKPYDAVRAVFGADKLKGLLLEKELNVKFVAKQTMYLAGFMAIFFAAKQYQTPSSETIILSEQEKKDLELQLTRLESKLKQLVKLYEMAAERQIIRDRDILPAHPYGPFPPVTE